MKQGLVFGSLLVIIPTANLYAQYASLEWLNYVSKPLMMPLLVAWLFVSGIWQNKKIALNIIIALFSSWLGDIFMMFQHEEPILFILGLSAFLIAHVFYIVTYKAAMTKGTQTKMKLFRAIVTLFIAGYLYLLLSLIMGSLGAMRYPVIIYGIVISTMLWISLDRRGKTNPESYILVSLGSALFIISDSIIALNKFYSPINQAGLWIMATYITAQLLISTGILSHLRAGRVVSTIL